MLIGEYNQSIDAKGRVNIPAKFREDLGASFVVAKGLDACVCIYPKTEWEKFQAELLSDNNVQRRRLHRYFFSGAVDCEIDSQGRALIPPTIREFAGLDKEIVVIGVSNRVEIWNKEKWNEYMDTPECDAEEIAKVMEELGL